MDIELINFLENKTNFHLKNKLDEELSKLLYSLQSEINKYLDAEEDKPDYLRQQIPRKISIGNNHHGFPYQVLDYPALFSKSSSFSFRTSR